MEPLFNKIVIAGVGLIGGSLALAGKKAGLFGEVVGVSRKEETLAKAKELGIIDDGTTSLTTATKGADLFFAATPPESIVTLCLSVAPHLPKGCIITDGGSVKEQIVNELTEKLPGHVHFVGGHPVAGTENSGPEAAFDTLYADRYVILTPIHSTNPKVLGRVTEMWESVGANVVNMTPNEHDKTLAVISHLPHLAAYALVDTLDEADKNGAIKRFAAGGFKDITRIAASDPTMWKEIFAMNRENLLDSIGLFEKWLETFKQAIETNNFHKVQELLEKAHSSRKDIS